MLTPTTLKQMTSEDLRKNILSTYFALRLGIVVLSAALPVGLYGYNLRVDHGLVETSMSAFYGAHEGTMRNWFVGVLCAVGAFLILYQGFSHLEDWLLNLAGGFAVLTAITPCNCWCDALGGQNRSHNVFATAFFVCMALVIWCCAEDTVTLLPDQALQQKFRRAYRSIGFGLAGSPLAALAVSYVLRNYISHTFYVEWFGVWAFAFYWFTKSGEFRITSAEKRALRGELKNVTGYGLAPAAPAEPLHRRRLDDRRSPDGRAPASACQYSSFLHELSHKSRLRPPFPLGLACISRGRVRFVPHLMRAAPCEEARSRCSIFSDAVTHRCRARHASTRTVPAISSS